MLKKMVLTMGVLGALTASAVGFASVPAQRAIDAAKAELPAGVVMYGVAERDDEYVINFRDNATYLEYEVEVKMATAKVDEIEIKGSNIPGSTTVVKTPAEIRAIILETYPDATNIEIELEQEGNNKYYEAEFFTPKFKGEAKLNPVTGAFGKRELDYF